MVIVVAEVVVKGSVNSSSELLAVNLIYPVTTDQWSIKWWYL